MLRCYFFGLIIAWLALAVDASGTRVFADPIDEFNAAVLRHDYGALPRLARQAGASAQTKLGLMYYRDGNHREAMKWFLQAAGGCPALC